MSTKLLVLGDIHGRTCWKEIIEKEKPLITVFLGDYVTTHDKVTAKEQIDNLNNILDYKEVNSSRVILLRGNHDMQHLGYSWAECSGFNKEVCDYMMSIKDRFLKNTQWIYRHKYVKVDKTIKILFSHAGISQVWLDENKLSLTNENVGAKDNINSLEPSELFGFTPNSAFDICGTSNTQPPTWIRPQSLARCLVENWIQVVGHTPVITIKDIYEATRNHNHLWLCDCLPREYLVIEDGDFLVKKTDENIINLPNRYNTGVYLYKTIGNWYKLCFPNKNEYEYLSIIGDSPNIEAVDPSGGPYLSVGSTIEDKTIKEIKQEHNDILLLIE